MSRLPYTNESQRDEHDNATPDTKRVSLYGWDAENLQKTRLTVTGGKLDVQDESVILLRRVVKLLESNAVVDVANRQRVTVEGATLTSGTVTTVSTVSNLALIAGVDPRFQMIDWARQAYNSGIRSNLAFT